ncbi:MAG: tetratricopeptide repeat protein [Kiritimatiellaeota bacterium]|nr:tetratricopeptide repeat protein [Kiritimatiellota bacterium]
MAMFYSKRLLRRGFVFGLALAVVLPALADMNELAMRGEECMNKGQVDQAIGFFEKIVQTGQTYESILSVKFDLAWCYYQRGYFAKALPLLADLCGDRAPSEDVKEQSAFLMGECHARLGASQTGKGQETERKKNLAKAIDLHNQFMQKFPKSQNYPYALYGRAYAYYLNDEPDKAREDLSGLIARFGNTPVGMSAQYLLASVYSQQGLDRIKAGKREEAQTYLDKARKAFDQIAKSDDNLALANDSNFSLAETWFEAGQYSEAIQYFRNVRPKTFVLKDLKIRLEAFRTKQANEIARSGNIKAFKNEIGRAQGQYLSIQESPDPMVNAYFRIAEAFFRMKRYGETAVICQHLLSSCAPLPAPQFQQASMLMINSYIAQKDLDTAAQAYENFKATAGADVPIAETVALSLGQLYFVQGNITNALQYFTESEEFFPNGKGADDALYMKAASEFSLGRSETLPETVEQYIEKFPKGHFEPNLLYYKAIILAGTNQWQEALDTIDELLAKYPKGTDSFESMDEVLYQKGVYLTQLHRPKEAVKLYESFLKSHKDSRMCPFALYQMSLAFNDNGELAKAVAALEQLAHDYASMDIAPQALFRIGVLYYEKADYVRMSQAFEKVTTEFPNSPLNADAFFFLGWVGKEKLNNYDDAIPYLWQSLELNPGHERAPELLFLIAQCCNEKAQRMGQPTILPDEQRMVYRQTLLDSADACESLLVNYSASDQALSAIPGIADAIFNLARFQMMSPEDAAQYFVKAIARHKGNPGLQAQLMFSQGMFLMKNAEKDKALVAFKQALTTSPNVRLSAQMLLDYADACKDANDLQGASSIYQRVLTDFASDPYAVAPAKYGLADILFYEGKNNDKAYDEADQAFTKVLKDFPWFEKGKQGRVKIAQIRERRKDYESAERIYTDVATQERTPEARIAAMLGVIRCQLAMAKQLEKQGNKTQALAKFTAADGSASKIIVLFEAYPEFVAEAIWDKGQIYEMQNNYDMAREQYERLTKEYKQYSWAKQAEERLKGLPASVPKTGGK